MCDHTCSCCPGEEHHHDHHHEKPILPRMVLGAVIYAAGLCILLISYGILGYDVLLIGINGAYAGCIFDFR